MTDKQTEQEQEAANEFDNKSANVILADRIDQSISQSCSSVPTDNSVYKHQDYWDSRFKLEKDYEWLGGLSAFQHLLIPQLNELQSAFGVSHPAGLRLLLVGVGNSALSAQLYALGYHQLVNIDYSPVVIEAQRERYAQSCPHMQWLTMDMRALPQHLPAECESFHAVIDKAAMDALTVDEGSCWEPAESVLAEVSAYLRGVDWLLKPNGRLFQISFAQPHFRIPNYLTLPQLAWKEQVESLTFSPSHTCFPYYFYVCKKPDSSPTVKVSVNSKSSSTEICSQQHECQHKHDLQEATNAAFASCCSSNSSSSASSSSCSSSSSSSL